MLGLIAAVASVIIVLVFAAGHRKLALGLLAAPLAFDHGVILADYQRYRADGRRPPPDGGAIGQHEALLLGGDGGQVPLL